MARGKTPELVRPSTRSQGAHRTTTSQSSWAPRALGALVAVVLVVVGVGALLLFRGDPAPDDVAFVPAGSGTASSAPAESTDASEPADEPSSPPQTAERAVADTESEAAADSGSTATGEPSQPSSAATAPEPVSRPSLTVLNNSTVSGLAGRSAERFRAEGWPVGEVGNLQGRLAMTTVYYAPGQEQAARALAREFPGIRDIQPRYSGLPGSGLTVVLTKDFR